MYFSRLIGFLCALVLLSTAMTQSPSSTSTSSTIYSNSSTTSPTSSFVTTLPTTTYFSTTTSVPQNFTIVTSSSSVVVVPVAEPTFIPRNTTAPPKVAGEYKLRTQVLGSGAKRFNKLYLGGWPLTANYYADIALTSNKSNAALFYLNGSMEQLDFGELNKYWSMTPALDSLDTRWYTVSARSPLSYKYGTFFLNSTGLQWTPNSSPPPHTGTLAALDLYFAGWMACDWWHGVPQLFYKVSGWHKVTVTPGGCADILLLPEYF